MEKNSFEGALKMSSLILEEVPFFFYSCLSSNAFLFKYTLKQAGLQIRKCWEELEHKSKQEFASLRCLKSLKTWHGCQKHIADIH